MGKSTPQSREVGKKSAVVGQDKLNPDIQNPEKYHFKPIVARDMKSIPLMFQAPGFRNIIRTGPIANPAVPSPANRDSSTAPKPGPVENNILLTIAPQTQFNGKKRLYTSKDRHSDVVLPNTINFDVAGVHSRPRSYSDPSPIPNGLKSDQQLADYKRRRMMQHAFSQLETLVPQRFYGRPSRANVLMGAVDYMIHLQSLIGQLERQSEDNGLEQSPT